MSTAQSESEEGMNARPDRLEDRGERLAEQLQPAVVPVWSGPGAGEMNTRRAYRETIRSARRSIWAINHYGNRKARPVLKMLANQMQAHPNLRVKLVLQIHLSSGEKKRLRKKVHPGSRKKLRDTIVENFAERFWENVWPSIDARPDVFYDCRAFDTTEPWASVHAKAVVVDSQRVFASSANFSDAALDRNIELGFSVRDGAIAHSIVRHLEGLITKGIFLRMPDL